MKRPSSTGALRLACLLALGMLRCEPGFPRELSGKQCGPFGECLSGYRCEFSSGLCISNDPLTHVGPDGGAAPEGGVGLRDVDERPALDGGVEDCESPQSDCDGVCVNLFDDPASCGACGKVCSVPSHGTAVCASGSCGVKCDTGYSACGTRCVDLGSDPAFCGSCTTACDPGERCSSGACALDCGATLVDCGGACVSTSSDPANCGGCGNACSAPTHATASCTASACSYDCTLGFSLCGGNCLDLMSDGLNCGACGRTCTAPAGGTVSCLLGVCVQGCPLGMTVCDGKCADLLSDERHCGTCSKRCKASQRCLAGLCISDDD